MPKALPFADNDKKEIFRMYEGGSTYSEIARQYGVDRSVITKLLSRNGFAPRAMSDIKRKYTLNEDYFDVISENQAYILGLLFADGSNNTSRGEVVLQLELSDREVLEKVNREIGSNRPLRTVVLKDPKHAHQSRLRVASRKISDRLDSLGMTHNKTYTLAYPAWLPQEMQRHFIRGYVDGDGYTSRNECSIIGTKGFCEGVACAFSETLGVTTTVRLRGDKGIHVELRVGGRLQCRKVYEWLYADASLYMRRKHEVAMKSLEYPPNRKKDVRLCSADGCTRTHHAQGFCQLHYYRATKRKRQHTVARGT
jgi:hypothetical protein